MKKGLVLILFALIPFISMAKGGAPTNIERAKAILRRPVTLENGDSLKIVSDCLYREYIYKQQQEERIPFYRMSSKRKAEYSYYRQALEDSIRAYSRLCETQRQAIAEREKLRKQHIQDSIVKVQKEEAAKQVQAQWAQLEAQQKVIDDFFNPENLCEIIDVIEKDSLEAKYGFYPAAYRGNEVFYSGEQPFSVTYHPTYQIAEKISWRCFGEQSFNYLKKLKGWKVYSTNEVFTFTTDPSESIVMGQLIRLIKDGVMFEFMPIESGMIISCGRYRRY